MIKKIVLLLSIAGLIFITSCSKSDNIAGNDGGGNNATDTTNYYPNKNGNYYKYSIESTDSNGTKSTGTRSATFNGTKMILGTEYQVQVDSTTLANVSTTNESYFRESQPNASDPNYGVYVYLDTSGISEFIPDSLSQYLQISNEMIIYSFPLTAGKTWPVFSVKLDFGIAAIQLVSVNATYLGIENVTLNLVSGSKTMSAAKIKYDLTLTIPDANNIFGTPSTQVFSANAWLVKNIGPVKWSGNATLLNAVVSGDIQLADTTGTISQSLIGYKVN
jgi:hypothetical protein